MIARNKTVSIAVALFFIEKTNEYRNLTTRSHSVEIRLEHLEDAKEIDARRRARQLPG